MLMSSPTSQATGQTAVLELDLPWVLTLRRSCPEARRRRRRRHRHARRQVTPYPPRSPRPRPRICASWARANLTVAQVVAACRHLR
ncbi:hypothetical protein OH76DRAFT_218942 [Lentinus brumalis]|uniref:Uncharacterized protein n=1 Tax=Lentinus brumalis TaxID=2498619 RepID=A0A371CM56_9APHY|nr:hypothetical protein OH76DRAFT_218942 [Polyporus brumalis]